MSRPDKPRFLVARGVDGLLVGWLAVFVWIAIFVADRLGTATAPGLTAIFWTGAVLTAAHFGLSYHLAYRDGAAAVRARPFALLYGPLALAAVLAATVVVALSAGDRSTRTVTGALITSVYLMTTWHYVKQVYGVARVGAAYAGVRLATWDVRILRYGLYPLWFLGAAQVLVRGSRYELAGYRFGVPLLPVSALDGLRLAAVVAAVPVLVVVVRVGLRGRRLPPSLVAGPYLAAFLWLGLPINALTLLLLAPFHALQYLAIGHRAEIAIAPRTRHTAAWWLNIFGGAAAGGLLASRFVPQWLDRHVHAAGGGLLFAACFFVFLNLHHYLIDATIWRSRGELVKAMVGRPAARTPAVASGEPVPAA